MFVNCVGLTLRYYGLIVGSSIVMQTNKGPLMLGFPVFAFLGYTIASVIGLYWAIAILRSGRL